MSTSTSKELYGELLYQFSLQGFRESSNYISALEFPARTPSSVLRNLTASYTEPATRNWELHTTGRSPGPGASAWALGGTEAGFGSCHKIHLVFILLVGV